MRQFIKEFAKICAETLPTIEPIYEFGSFRPQGQEILADMRSFFPNKKYIGTDMREGLGVDVILNLHNIDLPSESVGTTLILETLEHVEFPGKAVEEAYRILKPNGILIISSAMNYPIHNHPSDYWRFTPEAFKSLLRMFSFSIVESLGENDFPHSVVGVGFKNSISENTKNEFLKKISVWKTYWDNPPKSRWKKSAKLFIPPIVLDIYHKFVKIKY